MISEDNKIILPGEIWKEFYVNVENESSFNNKKNINKSRNNSSLEDQAEQTDFMKTITSQIKISEVAEHYLINNQCPECQKYVVNFNDTRGWFCCQDHNHCDFKGNLIDFIFKCRRLKNAR